MQEWRERRRWGERDSAVADEARGEGVGVYELVTNKGGRSEGGVEDVPAL
jgi:hypothetical protein